MSLLRIYQDDNPDEYQEFRDGDEIRGMLAGGGVIMERWQADAVLSPRAEEAKILEAYKLDVDRLKRERNLKTADVISVTPQTPGKEELRRKFLSEHTHSDDEIRFFVEGEGLFYIHISNKIYVILCEQGDLLNVPAGVTHWFDMGPEPYFKCIRLFGDPAGWVALFTGSDIAEKFPRYENFEKDYTGAIER